MIELGKIRNRINDLKQKSTEISRLITFAVGERESDLQREKTAIGCAIEGYEQLISAIAKAPSRPLPEDQHDGWPFRSQF